MGFFNQGKPSAPVGIRVSASVYGAVVPVVVGAPKRETRPTKGNTVRYLKLYWCIMFHGAHHEVRSLARISQPGFMYTHCTKCDPC